MRTENQRQASRINGARSNGPATPEGKATSSRNALQFGICVSDATFYDDPQANTRIAQLRTEYFAFYQPRSPFERDCIEEVALCVVRLDRLRRIGEGLMADNRERAFVTQTIPGPDGKPVHRFDRSLYPPEEQSTVLDMHLAVAWRQNPDVFESLSRQETRLSNRIRRAERRFQELVDARQKPPEIQPEPAPPEEEKTGPKIEPEPILTPAVPAPEAPSPQQQTRERENEYDRQALNYLVHSSPELYDLFCEFREKAKQEMNRPGC